MYIIYTHARAHTHTHTDTHTHTHTHNIYLYIKERKKERAPGATEPNFEGTWELDRPCIVRDRKPGTATGKKPV